MIIVDTSFWIDHFRNQRLDLLDWARSGQISIHELVLQELLMGNLKNENLYIDLKSLHTVKQVSHDEFLIFLKQNRLRGRGVGVVDAHLIVSALIEHAQIATLDKKLNQMAKQFGIGVLPKNI